MPNSTIKIFKRMKEFRGFSGKAENIICEERRLKRNIFFLMAVGGLFGSVETERSSVAFKLYTDHQILKPNWTKKIAREAGCPPSFELSRGTVGNFFRLTVISMY